MPKYIIILLLIIAASGCINESKKDTPKKVVVKKIPYQPLASFNGDTLAYINKNFIERKGFYKNKELKILLEKLELHVVNYYVSDGGSNYMQCNDISFSFLNENEMDKKVKHYINPVTLVIRFKTPFPLNSIIPLIRKNHGAWTAEEKAFVGKQLIGDISKVDYFTK